MASISHTVDPIPTPVKRSPTVHQIGIEDFAGFDGYFDHVLAAQPEPFS